MMGLDVIAFSELKKLDVSFNSEGDPILISSGKVLDDDEYFQAYINPDFPSQGEKLEDGAVYSYANTEGFWSGSYSSYNRWRERLAKLAGYPAIKYHPPGDEEIVFSHAAGAWAKGSGPFIELIDFTDCDGVIDSETAAKLYNDFLSNFHRLTTVNDISFMTRYVEWMNCFRFASKNGAVLFN